VIKSFYNSNYVPLKVRSPKSWPSTRRKVPSPEELARMVDVTPQMRDKAIIICLYQSGISVGDFLGITYEMVKEQLESGVEPIHLPMERSKVRKPYDTFLGADSIIHLKKYLEKARRKPSDPLFPVSPRTVENIVKKSSIKAGVKPYSTPHCLRKAFSTRLKLDNCPDELVEYWLGHKLRYGGAYFIPPIESQREIYRKHEHAISIPKS